jgi:hypothetical protein
MTGLGQSGGIALLPGGYGEDVTGRQVHQPDILNKEQTIKLFTFNQFSLLGF